MPRPDILLSWLQNAYAMEQSQREVLAAQINEAADHPELRDQLQRHLDQTGHHAELVQMCIERFRAAGVNAPAAPAPATILGRLTVAPEGEPRNDLMQGVLEEYATECYEIGCYTVLIEAAMRSGHGELIVTLEEILEEEEDMVEWFEDHLPALVETILQESAPA